MWRVHDVDERILISACINLFVITRNWKCSNLIKDELSLKNQNVRYSSICTSSSSVPRLYITYIMIYIHIYVMNRLGTEEDLYRKTTSLHGSICPNNEMLTSQNVNFIVESCRVFVYENIQHSPGTSEMLCFILAPSKYIWSPLGISIFWIMAGINQPVLSTIARHGRSFRIWNTELGIFKPIELLKSENRNVLIKLLKVIKLAFNHRKNIN